MFPPHDPLMCASPSSSGKKRETSRETVPSVVRWFCSIWERVEAFMRGFLERERPRVGGRSVRLVVLLLQRRSKSRSVVRFWPSRERSGTSQRALHHQPPHPHARAAETLEGDAVSESPTRKDKETGPGSRLCRSSAEVSITRRTSRRRRKSYESASRA
jgi:hypothetical protein